MILPIYIYGNSVLRKKCEEVPQDYPDLKELIANMFETMDNAEGVGLAAPQVGLALRMFVVDTVKLEKEVEPCFQRRQVFINPKILQDDFEKVRMSEGCLSIPGLRADVPRSKDVKVQYYDEDWNQKTELFSAMLARVFFHEYDHIEGKLFIDNVSPLKKELIKKELKKIAKGDIDVDFPYVLSKK